jgi:hypothetical protein
MVKQAETTWAHSSIIQRAINTRIFGNRITTGSKECHVERGTINIPNYSNMRQKFPLIHLLKNLGKNPIILHEVKHALYMEEPRFYILAFCICNNIGMVKVTVKQSRYTWSGPEGSRKLRFPDFMTMAQDGGKVSPTHRLPLPPGNTPGTHFC